MPQRRSHVAPSAAETELSSALADLRREIDAPVEFPADVLAEAEDVIVGVLFDDIVRTLLRPSTAPIAERARAATPARERTEPAPATVERQHSRPGSARSPPRG